MGCTGNPLAAAGEAVAERQRVLHPLQQAGRGQGGQHLPCRSQRLTESGADNSEHASSANNCSR